MPSDKYKEFRNLIFNELQITKDDIRQWAREAAREAAEQSIRGIDIDAVVEAVIRRQIGGSYTAVSRQIVDVAREDIASELVKRIKINVSDAQ